MSYHGVDKLIQYSNKIIVNVSQSPDKVKNITSFKKINVKCLFNNDYDINSNSLFIMSHKMINIDNNLTAPNSGYVNLFFTTIGVKNSSASAYHQSNKNILIKKTINVKYKNTNSYSINLPNILLTTSKIIIVDSNNSDQILTIDHENDQIIANFYQNPATTAQDIDFSDNDLWS